MAKKNSIYSELLRKDKQQKEELESLEKNNIYIKKQTILDGSEDSGVISDSSRLLESTNVKNYKTVLSEIGFNSEINKYENIKGQFIEKKKIEEKFNRKGFSFSELVELCQEKNLYMLQARKFGNKVELSSFKNVFSETIVNFLNEDQGIREITSQDINRFLVVYQKPTLLTKIKNIFNKKHLYYCALFYQNNDTSHTVNNSYSIIKEDFGRPLESGNFIYDIVNFSMKTKENLIKSNMLFATVGALFLSLFMNSALSFFISVLLSAMNVLFKLNKNKDKQENGYYTELEFSEERVYNDK